MGTLKPHKMPGPFKAGYSRAKAGTKNAYWNAAGKKAEKTGNSGWSGDYKFGTKSFGDKSRATEARGRSFQIGAGAGAVGGIATGMATYASPGHHDTKVLREYRKPSKVNKRGPKVHTITDLGSGAARTRAKRGDWSRHPFLSKPAAATGFAIGGLTTHGIYATGEQQSRNQLDSAYKRQQRKLKKQSLQPVAKAKYLEKYTPTKEERIKRRVQAGATSAGTSTAIYGAYHHVGNKALKKLGAPKVKNNPKAYAAVAGVGAAFGAAGKYRKQQYRVVEKRGPNTSAFGVNHG